MCSNLSDFNIKAFLSVKLLILSYTYIVFFSSKLYHRHSGLIVKYNVGLKALLQQCISEPVFYGEFVYKLKTIVKKPFFNDQLKRIIKRYQKWYIT